MRKIAILLFIFAASGFSQEEKKQNEIGYENGIIYVFKGFQSLNVGTRIQPSWSYSENSGATSSNYSGGSSSSSNNYVAEIKSLSLGLQFSKEYTFHKYLVFEPYSDVGYLFSANTNTPILTNVNGSTGVQYATSNQNGDANGFFAEAGVKPGLVLWNTIKLYTSFGININYNHSETKYSDQYSTSTNNYDTWTISYFGEKINYQTSVFLSVLF